MKQKKGINLYQSIRGFQLPNIVSLPFQEYGRKETFPTTKGTVGLKKKTHYLTNYQPKVVEIQTGFS